jgi:hypothetical protein
MRVRSAFAVLAAVIALVAGIATGTHAITPAQGYAAYEIPLPSFDLFTAGKAMAAQRGAESTQALTARYGGDWSVYSWNPQTSTPANLYGSGIDIAPGFASASDAEQVGRQVIAANPAVFGADPENLRFLSSPVGLGKRVVHFQQTYHGIDVWQGRVHLTFMENGRLFEMGSTYYPDIQVNPVPALTAATAEQIAAAALPFDSSTDFVAEGTQLLVLPVSRSETAVDYHLVYRVRVQTENPYGKWVTHVDAHSGEIIWRYNDVYFTNFTGNATIGREDGTYCNGEQTVAAAYLRVNVTGVGTTNTDINSTWTIPYGGTDSKTVTSDLYGPYVDVNNYNGAQGAFTGTATPGTPFTVTWNDLDSRQDERDVFDAVNDIHVMMLDVDPTFGYTNQRISAYVNRNDGYCPGNAWWDGTINFCAAGGSYANTGEQQGVTYHEYGHGIQDALLGGWQGDEGLGEGNGDVLSNMMTREAIIGRGFYTGNCTSGIRNSENHLMYPADVVGQEIHAAGQVIAGFHWDALQGLETVYSQDEAVLLSIERWHFGRKLEQPTTQPAQVLATFIADDDDGNLGNGTPHYQYFCQAAQNHGFSCPEILVGVFITHTPIASTVEQTQREVVATITSTEGAIDQNNVYTRYRVNGGAFQQVTLTPTGTPNQFHCFIPGQAQGSEIEYYLFAADTQGNTKTDPATAPAALHPYDIAWLIDPLEVESGWTVNLESTDTATTGIWVREDPVTDNDAQPENDHTPDPGVLCWLTGNAPAGQPSGTNDVDGGATSVYSPIYDLSTATSAKAKYWRWYSNNMGNNANQDTWVVQARNNGGAWVDVERNQDAQNQWSFREADLSALFGAALGQVQMKFIASDEAPGSLVEALVDDFELLASFGSSPVADGTAAKPRFAFQGSRSNPVLGATEIRFEVPAPIRARLAVYDVTGRLTRTLADGIATAGVNSIAWDGTNAAGQPVSAGVYFLKLQAGEFHATRTVVVNR